MGVKRSENLVYKKFSITIRTRLQAETIEDTTQRLTEFEGMQVRISFVKLKISDFKNGNKYVPCFFFALRLSLFLMERHFPDKKTV